jgi:glycosyltransferase involved in cell wall biosynthesis
VSARAKTIDRLRGLARRPRAWIRSARAHRATRAARLLVRTALGRAWLIARALPGRRARGAQWAALGADIAALGPPPASTRSVAIVVLEPDDPAAAARVAAASTTDLLCLVLATTTTVDGHAIDEHAIPRGWIARLAEEIDGTAIVAAAPLLVHPVRSLLRATPHDSWVRAKGLSLAMRFDEPVLRAGGAGTRPVVGAAPESVPGATAACLVVDRRAFAAVGGLPDLADVDVAVFELCRRLRALGGGIVVVPGAVAVDHRPVHRPAELRYPVSIATPAWRAYVEEHGSALMHEADPLPPGRLRIAITVAAPSAKVAPRWGDWHLAQAFARALRRHGHSARVQTLDHADDLAGRACDVHCVIRGLHTVRRTAGQAHVLWIISHPETIDAAECDDADLVLVASVRFADALRTRTTTPVEVLLQAAADRFRPRPVIPEHAHDIAIVAKSRDVFRSAAADALAAGLRPAIYGSGWEPFVDPALIVRQYVPNEELPNVYSSIGVLLNDHWDTMREWGFVSNRLFDALACATPVISDDLPEIDELFEGAVLTYHDVDELRALVAATLSDRDAARARAERGRELVAAHHTFDHRVRELVGALRRHGLASLRSG